MLRLTAEPTTLLLWGDSEVSLRLIWGIDRPVLADVVTGNASRAWHSVQPLVEILAVGQGRSRANLRNTGTAIGERLRYTGHEWSNEPGWRVFQFHQADPVTGIAVTSHLRLRTGGHSAQSWTEVRNEGAETVHLQAVSSLMLGSPVGPGGLPSIKTTEGYSEWVGEGRWLTRSLRSQDALPDVDLPRHQHQDARGASSIVSHSTWSSGERLPAGVLTASDSGLSLAWQVEHNGPWRSELGERLATDGRSLLALGLLGPTDADHGWLRSLRPGEVFTSVPVSVAAATGGWSSAIAELTRHRRALRPPQRAPRAVVFNDYMNTLMGDPTTAKLLPLIDAAAKAEADYFCIDAGWYDDNGDWWDSVGEWKPSRRRFADGGLERVLQHIRSAGLVPGLWLEPEVIGVRSPLAAQLPGDAFLERRGVRITEQGRYFLDFRHPAARAHLDAVVDRLIGDFGVGYFKLDYNVTPGVGTDLLADSPGDGLLRHSRAYLEWLDAVLERHPQLVVENCASGAMRADYALLSRVELQSTSDQQAALLYPPIAAGALMSILPEQACNWAYPQPDMTAEEIVFTMVTGLSGRLYLSGRLDQMDPSQLGLVSEGVRLAHQWDDAAEDSVPIWPLGLPGWTDGWIAVGRATEAESLVAVWWRGTGEPEAVLDLPPGEVDIAYPSTELHAWQVSRTPEGGVHLVPPSSNPSARILRVRHQTNNPNTSSSV